MTTYEEVVQIICNNNGMTPGEFDEMTLIEDIYDENFDKALKEISEKIIGVEVTMKSLEIARVLNLSQLTYLVANLHNTLREWSFGSEGETNEVDSNS